jgi:hypothetical protein
MAIQKMISAVVLSTKAIPVFVTDQPMRAEREQSDRQHDDPGGDDLAGQ